MDPSSQQNATTHDADGNHDPGKMFVGGLSWETSTDGLRKYFCQFGEVKECVIMRDTTTRRSRGFGFVTFSDPAHVETVIQRGTHEVDKKKVDPKVAFPKRSHPKVRTVNFNSPPLFLFFTDKKRLKTFCQGV
ncbi:RNA-binding protein Musashi homolog 2-like [Strongylocentrotus purpuratus]|uniref:RRM domain-containing protein n=1 Tax=Strongylocentrotus purpuratus TaxID=7668 RepID=A0A7M7N439_STRPU|nr:RNA-binding protein Musashi homolog 2-like [Strongylocentrotus purpuratus]